MTAAPARRRVSAHDEERSKMNKSTGRSVALVLALTGALLTAYSALGGGFSGAAWVGAAIATGAAVADVVRRQRRTCGARTWHSAG
jgi:hypothetical protein